MRSTPEEDRLAKRLAVVERDCARLREGPPPDAGLAGCGDHGCLVDPARGVGTNGGCHCPEIVLRRMLGWQAREIARLRAEAEECGDVSHRPDAAAVRAKIAEVGDLFDDAAAAIDRLAEILNAAQLARSRLRAVV